MPTHTSRMPTSSQNPETNTEAPSEAEDHVPPTASRKASPRHEPAGKKKRKKPLQQRGPTRQTFLLPPEPDLAVPRPTSKTIECNMMDYTDGEGVARRIYMPEVTMFLACGLFSGKRFDDLARFPAWGECFYILQPTCSPRLVCLFVLACACIESTDYRTAVSHLCCRVSSRVSRAVSSLGLSVLEREAKGLPHVLRYR